MKKNIMTLGAITVLGSGLFLFSMYEKKLLNREEITNNKSIAIYIKQEDGNYEKTDTIPESGYMLNEEKSVCTNNAKPSWNTKTKSLKINNLSSNNTSCYLYFEPTTEEVNTILGNITVNKYTPDFSKIATTDEGVFKTNDNDGVSYYWRGAATTNYVKFAGKCWRIIRINGDKTMRLIYDGATCHANGTSTTDSIAVSSTAYNSNYNKSEYVGWKYTSGSQRPSSITSGTDAPIKTTLENWYNSNIGNNTTYASKVADGKYCNDRNVQSGQSWSSAPSSTFYYAARPRLYTDYAPTLSCGTLDTYTLKVGLITADEVEFAGGKNADNKQYYLYNGQNYWTMSPTWWNGAFVVVFYVQSSGYLYYNDVRWTNPGVRPVINLKADTLFASGDGTLDNPYIVEGAE